MESCFQKQKGSLFMVKIKTVFCILCVCNPLFTSQHLLSWDMRLWQGLGGTTRTRWFSNTIHHDMRFLASPNSDIVPCVDIISMT